MLQAVRKAIVHQTNEFRRQHDLRSLRINRDLQNAATEFARYMAREGKYGHHADGQTPAERAKAAGYDYCVVLENIAYRVNTGEVTADSLTEVFVEGWIDSSSHRESILADFVSETGVGVATEDKTTFYAVQLFGRPRSAAIEIKIRNESTATRVLQIETNDSVDQIEMQPRMVLTMTRCFPTKLSLDERERDKSPQVIDVRESTQLTITEEGWQR